jgi:Excalibur calcium-binding domain
MIRGLLATATTAAVIFGTAISVAPAGAAPLDGNCIAGRVNADGSCYYANCSEAKANHECDIPEGDSHYCSKQDRDGDGIACEC